MHEMSSSGSEDESNLPEKEVCAKLCREFADVTGTDTALAQFYLQESWNLQTALNAFYSQASDSPPAPPLSKESGEESSHNRKKRKKPTTDTAAPSSSSTRSSSSNEKDQKWDIPDGASAAARDPDPYRFRLITWNIDGLDDVNLKSRMTGVAEVIAKEQPDVVFLQEVVPETFKLLKSRFSRQYHCLPGEFQGYFTTMLLNKSTVMPEQQEVIPFYTSKMCRNLMVVEANIKGVPVLLITTHLESTKPHKAERLRQLTAAFKKVTEADNSRTVIFGGDLNLRDEELASIGGAPDGVYDAWELGGKRPVAKYTWDLSKNDNKQMPGKSQPKLRFDRLYVRHSKPKANVKLVYFELCGIERLKSCQRFPSDHWGILTHYDIVDGDN
ncbi:tyrosyl-DNA phosphodiesterase 2-like [Tubulanus polymorphus]|uniref:tyrosyl-DNA phosphodiesterase 2-like n=1 Tax=Tubulanus polymorphus TaxID=672921 RepID=UPI003DA344B9